MLLVGTHIIAAATQAYVLDVPTER
eukprot:COSAG04_NODE_9986_length_814_cov_2.159441_1_plen_24_part_10